MTGNLDSISGLAADVRTRKTSAVGVVKTTLALIRTRNPDLNAVTRTLDERAIAAAAEIDRQILFGRDPGPLCGVPFGVKEVFDVAGLSTRAGSILMADAPAKPVDAESVRRLCAAGAIPVATLNMDEFAYGFATINQHYGITRNPHDTARLAGGSSGGSAAAVSAGMVAFSLGSDTNGSIRVPASLCGAYGLRPTHGTLPMQGVYPFVGSFDDLGPFARSSADLKLVYEILLGNAVAPRRIPSSRIAMLGGFFADGIDCEQAAALAAVAEALGGLSTIEIASVDRARSAAFLMTAAEGGALHLSHLREQASAFDPTTRDRLKAGALLPASVYLEALRFRETFRRAVAGAFETFDVLIAPATPCVAPRIDDPTVIIGGRKLSARSELGIFTQPLSFVGLPVISAPLYRPGKLPLGIQLVAAPGNETILFGIVEELERAGQIGFTDPDQREGDDA